MEVRCVNDALKTKGCTSINANGPPRWTSPIITINGWDILYYCYHEKSKNRKKKKKKKERKKTSFDSGHCVLYAMQKVTACACYDQ